MVSSMFRRRRTKFARRRHKILSIKNLSIPSAKRDALDNDPPTKINRYRVQKEMYWVTTPLPPLKIYGIVQSAKREATI